MGKVRIIKGVAVAPGLAMGPVHVVRAAPDVVPTWSLREEEVEAELQRLERGVEEAEADLERRQAAVLAHATEKDAEILSVHRMILHDPSARRSIEQQIRDERINAEACIQRLIETLQKTLRGLDGDSVRSYGADLSDPWRAVLDRLMKRDRAELAAQGAQVVLAAAELTPHVVTMLDRSQVLAIVTERGGRFSHGAVLARSVGFPCVVEVPGLLARLEQGMRVIVDGDHGAVQLRPEAEDVDTFLELCRRRRERNSVLEVHATQPATTPDGHTLEVHVNIESVRDLDTFDLAKSDGVGLLRTEFLYMERSQFPSEEEQYRLYRRVAERLAGRPVILRTLDIGADKQLPYFKTPVEHNPALGWRGLRVTLEWQDLMRVQLRAALRASAHGDLRILLPMVTSIEEVRQVRRMLELLRAQLTEQGYEMAEDVPLGIMAEVPSTVLSLEHFVPGIDFVSVGTNDLVQYLLAADRDNPWVSRLYDPQHPAVIWALARVADVARSLNLPCSVCGELAGDEAAALMLLGMGYDALSVAPNFLGEVKYAVRETPWVDAREIARRALAERSSEGVRAVLAEARDRLHARLGRMENLATTRDRRSDGGDPACSAPTP